MMNTTQTALQANEKEVLTNAMEHLHNRTYFSQFPESPKAYDEASISEGEKQFHARLNQNYSGLFETNSKGWVGEEVSPFLQVGLGIKYPSFSTAQLIQYAQESAPIWASVSVEQRAAILLDSLEQIKLRFSELAYATMHTTGQSFMMSFQASGPHALDRALETIALGHHEISRFANQATWKKNMGKFDLVLEKNYKAMAKGTGLLIGCSTFPTWNTLPGLYANLITGNNCIAKPHPKAIYPMAIVVEELQKVFVKHQLPATIVQLAPDTIAEPITKELCENPYITLVDYTGGNAFGNYVESLTGKTVFTEKAGVNSVIIDSTNDIQQTAQNLAFSLSLYSGQMCTAPQNIYVAESGIQTPEGIVSFEEFKGILANAITGLANHPKAGAGTLAAIQNDQTLKNIQHQLSNFSEYACKAETIQNPEFENARTQTISLAVSDSSNKENLLKEYFGPFAILVKTKDFDESLQIANESAKQKGAITCLAYCTNEEKMKLIEDTMNKAFTPVSFNLSGAAFVNQHAAFSDFHVTGGNPAGNASFTDPNFVNQRFVWVGNRYMKQ